MNATTPEHHLEAEGLPLARTAALVLRYVVALTLAVAATYTAAWALIAWPPLATIVLAFAAAGFAIAQKERTP